MTSKATATANRFVIVGLEFAVVVIELLAIAILVREILVRNQINHVSYDIRWLYIVPIFHALTVFKLRFPKPCEYWLNLFPAIALAASVFVFDGFNLLVEYGTWIDRGMPAYGAWNW